MKDSERTARFSISQHAQLSYEDVDSNGAPSRPLEFPIPSVGQAAWMKDEIYDPKSESVVATNHILFRVRGRGSDPIPEQAYWVRRKISDTVHGYVRLCAILRRRKRDFQQRPNVGPNENAKPGWSYRPSDGKDDWNGKAIKRPDKENDGWIWEPTGELVAVKMTSWAKVRYLRGRHLEDPVKEIAAMQLIGNYHPHILGCNEALQDERYLYMISPFCSGGDLFGKVMEDFKTNNTGRLTDSQARHWFRQIILSLLHLQKKGVCHRDICLENILVHKDKCKIIDMGMCLRVPYSDPNNEGCVTDVSADTCRRLIKNQGQGGENLLYLAPEIVDKSDSFDGFATDLWAVGVILYIMLVGHAPYKWAHESDKNFLRLINGDLAVMLKNWNISISDQACDLLQKLFKRDPRERPSLAQVMTHPWVLNEKSKGASPNPIRGKIRFQQPLWFHGTKSFI